MAQVNVTINGRQYRMACEDGQEDHLLRLARDLNQRIEAMRVQFGEVGDMRLAIMAAIVVSDELAETTMRVRRLEQEITALQDARLIAADRAQATEVAIVSAFNSAAERIEKVAKGLSQPMANGTGTFG
jgi:cell division protein ZapA